MIKILSLIINLYIFTLTLTTAQQESSDYGEGDVPQLQGRGLVGVNATDRENQYMVSLYDVSKNEHVCSGSLIGRKTVLTSAQCCNEGNLPAHFVIRYEGLSRKKLKRTIKITDAIIYPGDENSTCIIKLKVKFKLSATVKMIRIADRFPHVEDRVSLIAWSTLEAPDASFLPRSPQRPTPRPKNSERNSTTIKYLGQAKRAQLIVDSEGECELLTPNTINPICARVEQTDYWGSCLPNPGTALVFKRRIVGILSWSKQSAFDWCMNMEGLHFFVGLQSPNLRQWIQENIT